MGGELAFQLALDLLIYPAHEIHSADVVQPPADHDGAYVAVLRIEAGAQMFGEEILGPANLDQLGEKFIHFRLIVARARRAAVHDTPDKIHCAPRGKVVSI